MPCETWRVFAVTKTALYVTPAPAVLFVLTLALARATLSAIWSNLGFFAGSQGGASYVLA